MNSQGVGKSATNGTPTNFLDVLSANLQDEDATDRYVVAFWRRDGKGGHAVTPYAVENKGGGIFWVHVYDNNYPNDFNRRIKIDRNANTWVYEGAAINPSAPPSTYEGDAQTRSLHLWSTFWSGNTLKQCSFCTSTLPRRHGRDFHPAFHEWRGPHPGDRQPGASGWLRSRHG